ncbi:MAG TPA: CbtB-domain containing protein [Jatrophihabitantaceae bacterium]|nr:CbtB-domain containing protein [Jatrophihabitantaceae bacterium]
MSKATAATTTTTVALPKLSFRELAPWLFFGLLMMLMVLYFVGAEQGATSLIGGSNVHEFLHDARHLLGFPCH